MRHDAASCDDAELTRHPSAMAACGWDITVSVTEDGELHAWGHSVEGELGLGAVRRQNQPARAGGPELFGNQRIRLAAAWYMHRCGEDWRAVHLRRWP
jgi:alpha-tubulin suppressor-like RCC1 family protein